MITIKNKKISWYKNITLDKVLKKIKYGDQYYVVRLNGKLISKPNFKNTTIEDNSCITLLPLISGG